MVEHVTKPVLERCCRRLCIVKSLEPVRSSGPSAELLAAVGGQQIEWPQHQSNASLPGYCFTTEHFQATSQHTLCSRVGFSGYGNSRLKVISANPAVHRPGTGQGLLIIFLCKLRHLCSLAS